MTAAAWAALALTLLSAGAWLLLDTIEAHRRRRFDEHTEQAMRVVSPDHPSVWRRGDRD